MKIYNKEEAIRQLEQAGFKIVDKKDNKNYSGLVGSRTKPLIIKH